MSPETRRWPLVGLEDDATAVRAAVGRPGALVLVGPAGIGKTALAGVVATACEGAGRDVVRIVATPAAGAVPVGCLGPLLALAGVDADTPHLGEALVRALRRPGGAMPLLVIDDVPLLDAGSADVVATLVRADVAVLLATARLPSRLPAVLDALAVEDRLRARAVAPRTETELAAAAGAWLGGPLTGPAASRLWAACEGVPLHARELVRASVADGALVATAAGWDLVGPPSAPPSLVALAASRVTTLGDASRRDLVALSLAQPLSLAGATRLVGTDGLADLEAADLVTVTPGDGGPEVRLAHPLYGEAAQAPLGPLQRRAAAARAAEALDEVGADPDAALRAAALRVDHDLPVAAGVAVAAAQRALTRRDPDLALRLLDGGGDDGFAARLARGAALSAQGHVDAADAALAAALERAGDDAERARAVCRRANNLAAIGGRFAEAEVVLADGLGVVADPAWRSFVAADLAYARLWQGRRDGDVRPAAADIPAVVRANECLVGAVVAVMGGALARAEELVVEGLPLAPTLHDVVPAARELLTLSRFLALAWGGDAAGADAVVATELERAAAGAPGAPGPWLAVRAVQRLIDGALDAAVADAVAAERGLALVDVSGLRPLATATRATALARLGRIEESDAADAEVEGAWRDEAKVRVTLAQAAAWRAAATGRTRAAARLLAEAGQEAVAAGHVAFGGLAAHDAARLGHPQVALPVLRALDGVWEGPLSAAVRDHAEALAVGDGDGLLVVAGLLPGHGLTLSGAEAAAQAAQAFAAQGRDRAARHAEAVAAATAARLGPVASPALGSPRGLTPRQREIARLAATGATSASVAERLGLSIRTVDNHLAAAYRKLGISGRDQLRAALAASPAATQADRRAYP